ncbi:MAG: TRAP transporter substrate-binding protein DctP [Gammaproteobacteria bacterium]|nr:TRAP transporter substrate-binding protein DctP [Gammaproteobacteria bacterium]
MSISRKFGLQGLMLAMMAGLSVSTAQALTLKIATLSPEGTAWMQKMRAGAAEISEKTSDRVNFKFYPGGIMGDDESVLRKMRVGQLHGGAITGGSLAKILPDMLAYNMPFAFRNLDEVDTVRAIIDPELIAGLDKKSYVSFGLAEGGFAYLMSNKAVHSVADLKDLKVWAPNGDRITYAVFQQGGVTPVALPVSDVLTGLQTGLINTVSGPPIAAIALQWHTRVTHLTNLPLMYIYALMVIDKKQFMKISPADRTIVRDVMERIYKEIDRANRADNDQAIAALKSQGITYVELEQAERKRWYEIATGAANQLRQQGVVGGKTVDKMFGILKSSRAAEKK